MPVDLILGLQWGDEGKGKIVDLLSDKYSVIARFQGGPNAGHTIIIGDKKFVLHQIPSGIIREGPSSAAPPGQSASTASRVEVPGVQRTSR